MRFLTDTEIAAISDKRKTWVKNASTAYDWKDMTIADAALIRAQAQEFVRLADDAIARNVNALRAGGDISWVELGKVLGVSKQAAQKKFGNT